MLKYKLKKQKVCLCVADLNYYTYDSLKDVLIRYLNDTGRNVDGIKYGVYEENHGNVAVAYAVRHLRYLSAWCLMEIDRRRMHKKFQLPIDEHIKTT